MMILKQTSPKFYCPTKCRKNGTRRAGVKSACAFETAINGESAKCSV